MISPIPELGVEMAEESPRGGLPSPPEIETHFPQRFERFGQSGTYIVELVVRHDAGRQYLSGTMDGNISAASVP
jgi:hypothetical protein